MAALHRGELWSKARGAPRWVTGVPKNLYRCARHARALAPWREPLRSQRQACRVLRAFSVSGRTPYGVDIYSSAAGGVVDLPKSLAQRLGHDMLERVPDETPLRACPVMPGMSVETEA
jgi:hypothetical protein